MVHPYYSFMDLVPMSIIFDFSSPHWSNRDIVSYCSKIAIVLCSYHARMMTMMMFEEEQMRSSDIPRDGPIIRRIKWAWTCAERCSCRLSGTTEGRKVEHKFVSSSVRGQDKTVDLNKPTNNDISKSTVRFNATQSVTELRVWNNEEKYCSRSSQRRNESYATEERFFLVVKWENFHFTP